ncbi:MAG: hypothetical protein FJZ58_01170 [Chlamydiae bacterium]|nr:hypothetical protein [Chlamydiota bacterium]
MDRFADAVPVASTVTNLVVLVQKSLIDVSRWLDIGPSLPKEGYYDHINHKGYDKCLWLLVPLIGQAMLYYDYFSVPESSDQKDALGVNIPRQSMGVLTVKEKDQLSAWIKYAWKHGYRAKIPENFLWKKKENFVVAACYSYVQAVVLDGSEPQDIVCHRGSASYKPTPWDKYQTKNMKEWLVKELCIPQAQAQGYAAAFCRDMKDNKLRQEYQELYLAMTKQEKGEAKQSNKKLRSQGVPRPESEKINMVFDESPFYQRLQGSV